MKTILFFVLFLVTSGFAAEEQKVTLENTLSKLKIKGRASLGYLKGSGVGLQREGSFEVPDIKLQLNFNPDEKNTVTIRFNMNNAVVQVPFADYVFLQSKDVISSLKETPFNFNIRVGRFKLGLGEETWANNAIEGFLPSNSAANVDGIDEGIELSGKIWAFSVSNGNRGVGSDSHEMKAFLAKLFYSPWKPVYASATYYDSGNLNASQGEIGIGGVVAPPAGINRWKRQVWEVDLRYDFQKGTKPLNSFSTSDSKAIIRLSYGQFRDAPKNGTGRMGYFGFIDGMYNLSSKIYLGARASILDLRGGQLAAINNVTTNRYERFSLGGGYRWSDNVHIKLGYDINENGGAGTIDMPDNLISALLTISL